MPISYAAVMHTSTIRDELSDYVKVVLPSADSLEIAGDKAKTIRYAQYLGILTPESHFPEGIVDYMDIRCQMPFFPYVIKSPFDAGNMGYANDNIDYVKLFFKIDRPIVQEYIKGEGYGFFALYNHGEMRAFFMHHRLREYPATGGASALAESIYDEELLAAGKKILDELKWHGVAMVEFKKDEKDRFVLMEINPKFWGSLGLSVASEVNFPYLLFKLAVDGDIEPVTSYRTGIKFRWPFPQDTLNMLTTPGSKRRYISEFFNPSIMSDIDPSDIKPNILQVMMTKVEILIRIKRGTLMPHGRTPLR
jgi:predicted ATP-grasp superfamily ATP-dependent carboligase